MSLCARCGVEMEGRLSQRCPDDGRHRRTVLVPARLVDLLSGVYDDRGVRVWLRGANRSLGGSRPVDLIGAGRAAEVEAEVHRLRDGAFS